MPVTSSSSTPSRGELPIIQATMDLIARCQLRWRATYLIVAGHEDEQEHP
jgi:hypothetical protein